MKKIDIENFDERKVLADLLSDGFTMKFAKNFIERIKSELENPLYDRTYGSWALSQGFLLESAYAYGLNDKNVKDYLSDYDYYKMWPLNSWCRIWIDDKMTLKYILDGTANSDMLPKYYFYSTVDGLRCLMDNPYENSQSIDTLIKLLKDKSELACKPNNGSLSVGFFKLSYSNEKFYINEEVIDEKGLADFVKEHPNYIFTEYLYPCADFAKVHKLIHTLRVVIVNEHGNDPKIIGGYMRFGTSQHGNTNHMNIDEDCHSDYDFVADVNFEKGFISNAKSIYWNKVIDTPQHPESKALVEMVLPNWNVNKEKLLNLSKYLFNCQYIGIDACFTEQGLKIMEINSHSGIKYMQTFHPFLKEEKTKTWFQSHINSLSKL